MDALRRTDGSTQGAAPRTPEAPASRLELEPLINPPPAPAPSTAGGPPGDAGAKSPPARCTSPVIPPPRHALIVGLAGATALGALAIGIGFEMRPLALPERPHAKAMAAVLPYPEAAPDHPPAPPAPTVENPDMPAPQAHPTRAPANTARSDPKQGLPTTAIQPATAIPLQPGAGASPGSITSLAHAAYLNHDLPQAEMLYREALRAEPDDIDALRGLGTTLAGQHRWAEAGRTYTQARNLAPDDPDLSYNLAVTLDRAGQPGAAATHYRQALALATRSPARFNPAEGAARLRTLASQEPSP